MADPANFPRVNGPLDPASGPSNGLGRCVRDPWLGLGAVFLVSVFDLARFRPLLNLAFAVIFIGGLMRFTMPRPDILFGPDIAGSLAAELIGMPLLYVWLARVAQRS